jgi:hypothetical protein
MAKSNDPLPENINGHTWEFVPFAKGANIGSYRCSTCLTSYDIGHGRSFQCDKGEGFRKAVRDATSNRPRNS